MTVQALNSVINIFYDLIPDGRQFLNVVHPMLEHSRSFQFFEEKLRSIEVLNEKGNVEKVYFREPLVCKFLTGGDMEKFRSNLKLETHGGFYADMKHFVSESRDMYYHLVHKVNLSGTRFMGIDLGILTSSFSEHVRTFQVRCIYLVSIMVVLTVRSEGDWTCCLPFNTNGPYGSDWPARTASDDRGSRFSLETFYEINDHCGTEANPRYDAAYCTTGEINLDMLKRHKYAQEWQRNFVIVLLVLICICNLFTAVIHLSTKMPVNLDMVKRDELRKSAQDTGVRAGGNPKAFYSSTTRRGKDKDGMR